MAVFTVDGTDVDIRIADERFLCDLSQCKGACCTLAGGHGAPVTRAEVNLLMLALPVVKKYLPPEHLDAIELFGVVEESDGLYYTTCLNDRACVFVYYDQGIAKCAIEKAYFTGEHTWRKPLSCHLFPIRRSGGDHERLQPEQLGECGPAREAGKKENIPMYIFLREALVRAYGESWYREFRKKCEEIGSKNPRE